jgi:hypothetical protein
MSIKKTIINTLVSSFLCASSISVFANELPFKVAIIQDSTGSKDIVSGDYDKFINNLSSDNSIVSTFENNMGLCAVYIKTDQLDKSEDACTTAIQAMKSIKSFSKEYLYLRSVSLSNRGVSRYLNNDISGSIDDFTTALSIDDNAVTSRNFALVKNTLIKKDVTNREILSD